MESPAAPCPATIGGPHVSPDAVDGDRVRVGGDCKATHVHGVRRDFVLPITRTSIPTGWYGNDADVFLVGTDECGVEETYWALGADTSPSVGTPAAYGLAYRLYTGAISVQQEGKTALTVYSKDVNGNVEDKRVVYVKIDKTAPTVRCSLRRTFSAKATLRLTARDALSGVRSLSWSWDGHAAKKTSKASILVSTARAGVHTLRFWSRDRAGHVSAKHSIRVIVR